jgi:pentatricopeptide repeat protein
MQDALWLRDRRNPPWVEAKLAEMAPETVQVNVFSWNRRLARYVKAGQHEKTIQLFQEMRQKNISPNSFTFVPVLNACASLGALQEGRQVHEQIIRSSCEADVFVGCSLVNMYAKCRHMKDAWRVFKNMSSRDVVTWNTMILGHVKCGQGRKALELFQQMLQEGAQPDSVTFLGVLNACASEAALEEGRCAHEWIIARGWDSDVSVGNSLVNMYAKCGSMEDAQRVFLKMSSRDVVTWTAMILGHVKCGQGQKALDLFQQMQEQGVEPDSVTFVGVLNACASEVALQDGRSAHEQIIEKGLDSDIFVGSSLVDMYVKCGSMEDAQRVFNKIPSRDVVTWTAMIFGFVKCQQGQKALELFQQMQHEGVQPNSVTFVGVLNACASVVALEEGRRAHEQIIQSGWDSDVCVGNSLVDMYAKCGSIEDAWRVFNKMPSRDVVTWTTMMLGHLKCGQGQEALELFQQMQKEGVQPNSVTFVGALNACASVAALEEGRCAHERILQSEWHSNIFVGNSLVDMYGKCGSMEDAQRVFNNMPLHDVVSWNAILGGCAMHGHGKEALRHFELMCEEGVKPNDITFVCLLSACGHAGLVDEGLRCFTSMSTVYKISAKLEHYTCMVDLLGHSGRLQEAENMIQALPFRPDGALWMALLGACRIHANVEMGEHIAKRVLELEPENASGYVLLSNIYAAAGKRDLCKNIERQSNERGVKKQLGRTWIEVNNEVHTFVVDDQKHPQISQIHAQLKRLSGLMHDAGYVPVTEFVLHDVEEESKVFHLCHHSEKLAIAFGLINTDPGTPLRIMKNLRVCEDCHTSTKFIAKLVGRTIMVRDANRFHHFQDGVCSCMDYW